MPSTLPPDPITEDCLHRLEGHRTNEEYLANKGWKCPYCDGNSLMMVRRDHDRHVIGANISNTKLRRLVCCQKCQKEYWDVHELVGWTSHVPGDEDDRGF